MRCRILTVILSMVAFCSAAEPPPTPRRPVTNVYHGVEVVDEYQWLEDWDDPAVQSWSASQNEHARACLDRLPHAPAVRRQVTEILSASYPSFGGLKFEGGKLFAFKREPPKEQPFLVVLDDWNSPESARTIVDPQTLDSEGTTAIDWYVPSPDGRYVAVSMSQGGTESGDVYVYSVETGEQEFETVPNVNSGTAGGSLAWSPDGEAFYYTRHLPLAPDDPDSEDVYQQVYYHILGGDVEDDIYELGEGFPEIAEIQLTVDPPTGRVLATVQYGDGGEFAHYLRGADGEWRLFSDFGDGVKQAVFGPEEDLFVVTLQDSPRGRIVRVSSQTLDVAGGQLVLPERDEPIITGGEAFWGEKTVLVTKSRLCVLYQNGGPALLRVFDHAGKEQPGPETLPVSDIYDIVPLSSDEMLFANSSFVQPKRYVHFDAGDGQTKPTSLRSQSLVDMSDIEVVREFATSRDGTQVPLSVLMRRGAERNGENRCLVTGYGGYGSSVTPHFDSLDRVLFDRGFIVVVANLRGGGEYGEPWHLAGNLTNKQNVFDDFAAVIQHVIDRNYTQPKRLAIMGGSNGGLLMGAMVTQHPELMHCVVSQVGMYDMLRCELSPNGAFNVTEFGTVTNPDQFRAIWAYSPYHHVQDGAKYPAVLFMTGENDPRVDPAESRKMTARLQAANGGDASILLRTSANAGHGGDNSLSEEIEQSVDVYSFLFHQLGVPVATGE